MPPAKIKLRMWFKDKELKRLAAGGMVASVRSRFNHPLLQQLTALKDKNPLAARQRTVVPLRPQERPVRAERPRTLEPATRAEREPAPPSSKPPVMLPPPKPSATSSDI